MKAERAEAIKTAVMEEIQRSPVYHDDVILAAAHAAGIETGIKFAISNPEAAKHLLEAANVSRLDFFAGQPPEIADLYGRGEDGIMAGLARAVTGAAS